MRIAKTLAQLASAPYETAPMILNPEKLLAGLLAPLFALRGKNDLGIGDVGALRELIDWSASMGFGVLQLLPINETGNDNSPYNAISSVALEPTTIEIVAIPELTATDFQELTFGLNLEVLQAGPVAYPLVKALKRSLLRRAFENFTQSSWRKNDARARKFRAFTKAQETWLEPYALFRVLMDVNQGGERWDSWPEAQQTAASARVWLQGESAKTRRHFTTEIRFAMFIQWVAWTQWEAVKHYAESQGVALMGDVPFGVSYYSADVFGEPQLFNPRWSGGAPPEPLFKDDAFTCRWGQNWGVPLYDWSRMRADQFAWWRRRVRMVRDVFHLFRIDHVLGFFRIYGFPWRPQLNAEFLARTVEETKVVTGGDLPRFHEHDDETPEGRASNCAQGEEFLRVLLEETGEFRLVGEDLGTVPPYVRPSLHSLQIPGFRIPFWETLPDSRLVPGQDYDRLSIATFATHDHEPLRATWERWMGVIQAALIQPEALGAARDHTWWEVRRLAAWAGFEVPQLTPFEQVHEKFLGALFRCESWLAICMITDLFGTTQRFNVPGAVSESNWSQRLAYPIADWYQDADLNGKMAGVCARLRDSGRWPLHRP